MPFQACFCNHSAGDERAGCLAFNVFWMLCCCYYSLPLLLGAIDWSVVFFIVKYNIVGLKTILLQGILEPVFYGDLVYKFKRIVSVPVVVQSKNHFWYTYTMLESLILVINCLLFIHCLLLLRLWRFCGCSLFCYAIRCVLSSFVIISMGKRE